MQNEPTNAELYAEVEREILKGAKVLAARGALMIGDDPKKPPLGHEWLELFDRSLRILSAVSGAYPSGGETKK